MKKKKETKERKTRKKVLSPVAPVEDLVVGAPQDVVTAQAFVSMSEVAIDFGREDLNALRDKLNELIRFVTGK